MKRKIYSILLLVWTIVILVAVLLPKEDMITKPHFLVDIPHIDKVVHTVLFGVFAFLLAKVLKAKSFRIKILCIISIAIALIFGLLTECLQKILYDYIQRDFSWLDFLADSVGVSLALIIFTCCLAKRKHTKNS
jgi:hypothetical protein